MSSLRGVITNTGVKHSVRGARPHRISPLAVKSPTDAESSETQLFCGRSPGVDAAVVLKDTVKRGELVRPVRRIGTLVPATVVVIPASDTGCIKKRLVQPGWAVCLGTVQLELISPQVEQENLGAAAQFMEGPADLVT